MKLAVTPMIEGWSGMWTGSFLGPKSTSRSGVSRRHGEAEYVFDLE